MHLFQGKKSSETEEWKLKYCLDLTGMNMFEEQDQLNLNARSNCIWTLQSLLP